MYSTTKAYVAAWLTAVGLIAAGELKAAGQPNADGEPAKAGMAVAAPTSQSPVIQSALARACAALQPGHSTDFPTPGLKAGGATSDNNGWTYQTRWFFDGPRHCAWLLVDPANAAVQEAWYYDEAADSWTKLYKGPASKETTGTILGHVWDQHMLAPDGTLYFAAYCSKEGYQILRFDRQAKGPQGTGNWVLALELAKNLGKPSHAQLGLVWHPNLYGKDKPGIVICGTSKVWAVPADNGAQAQELAARTSTGDNTTGVYVSGLDAVICGGGINAGDAGHAMHMVRPGPNGPVVTALPAFRLRDFHPESPSTKLGTHNNSNPVCSKLVAHPNGKTALILEDSISPTRPGSYWVLVQEPAGGWKWALAGTHPFKHVTRKSGLIWTCAGVTCTLPPSYGCLLYGHGAIAVVPDKPHMILWKVPEYAAQPSPPKTPDK